MGFFNGLNLHTDFVNAVTNHGKFISANYFLKAILFTYSHPLPQPLIFPDFLLQSSMILGGRGYVFMLH